MNQDSYHLFAFADFSKANILKATDFSPHAHFLGTLKNKLESLFGLFFDAVYALYSY